MTQDYQDTFYKLICDKVRKLRIEVNLTQEGFADKLNISRSSIVNIEKYRQRPTVHLLYEIALLGGKKMDYFFDSLPLIQPEEIISKRIEKKIDDILKDDESKSIVQDFISRMSS